MTCKDMKKMPEELEVQIKELNKSIQMNVEKIKVPPQTLPLIIHLFIFVPRRRKRT